MGVRFEAYTRHHNSPRRATKMALTAKFGYIDYSGETTHAQFRFPNLTSANFNTLLTPTTGTVNVVRIAIDALTLLNETRTTATLDIHQAVATPPTDPLANREYGVRLYLLDNVTGQTETTFISGIDPTFLVRASGSDEVDLTITEWADLKTAVEADCVSRNGNAVTVVKGIVTGRNN
jgi:hypothetical protein